MSQFDFGTIDPNVKTGTQLAADLNQWRTALHSTHAGAARPAYAAPGMLWVDQTNATEWSLKMATASGDTIIGGINSTTNQLTRVLFADGTQAAPSITFAGDTTLGLFRMGSGVGVTSSLNAVGSLGLGVNGSTWRMVLEGTAVRQYFTSSATHTFSYESATGAFHLGVDLGSFIFSNDANTAIKNVAGQWSAPSDERVKERIEDFTPGLEAVLALRPRVFSFKMETGRDTTKRYVSLIAQEAQAALPETVTSEPAGKVGEMEVPGLLSFDPTNIQYALVNAMRELDARLKTLEGASA